MSSQASMNPALTGPTDDQRRISGLTTRSSQRLRHTLRGSGCSIPQEVESMLDFILYEPNHDSVPFDDPCDLAAHFVTLENLVGKSVSVEGAQKTLASSFKPTVQLTVKLGEIERHGNGFSAMMAEYAICEPNGLARSGNSSASESSVPTTGSSASTNYVASMMSSTALAGDANLRNDLRDQCNRYLMEADQALHNLLRSVSPADCLNLGGRRDRARVFIHTRATAMSLLLAIALAIFLALKQYISKLVFLPVAIGLAIVSVCFSQAALRVTGLSSALVKTFEQYQEIQDITDTIRLDALEFLKAYCEYYTVFLEVLDALAEAQALSTEETELLSRCIMNVKANFIPGSSKLSKSLSRKAEYLRARYNKRYGSLGGAV